jgi:hypothetical protein
MEDEWRINAKTGLINNTTMGSKEIQPPAVKSSIIGVLSCITINFICIIFYMLPPKIGIFDYSNIKKA